MKLHILFFCFLITSNISFSQISITGNEINSSIEAYKSRISDFNYDYGHSIFVLVLSCNDKENFDYSLSFTKSETMYEYANCDYYEKIDSNYVVIRINNCDSNNFNTPYPFKLLDKKTDSLIRTIIYPKSSIISGSYPIIVFKSKANKTDTVLVDNMVNLPHDLLHLYLVDFDYTDYLNNEMIKTCTEITRSTEFKTRGKAFSYYTDSLYNSIYCFETTSGINYRFPKKYSNNEAFEGVEFNFLENDSIIKLPDSDTLIIIRDDQIFHFPIPY